MNRLKILILNSLLFDFLIDFRQKCYSNKSLLWPCVFLELLRLTRKRTPIATSIIPQPTMFQIVMSPLWDRHFSHFRQVESSFKSSFLPTYPVATLQKNSCQMKDMDVIFALIPHDSVMSLWRSNGLDAATLQSAKLSIFRSERKISQD